MTNKGDDGVVRESDNFLFWCEKTQHLTGDDWRAGFDALNALIIKNKREGKENWPPSYLEFIEMARQSTISPDGGNSDAYLSIDDPRHSRNDPESSNYKRPAIADLGKKARNEKKRDEILTNLKDMMK